MSQGSWCCPCIAEICEHLSICSAATALQLGCSTARALASGLSCATAEGASIAEGMMPWEG